MREIKYIPLNSLLGSYIARKENNMPKLNMELMEIFDGEAIYYHSEDCLSYCDFACNGSQGDMIALAYNEGVKAAQQRLQADGAGTLPDSIKEALNSGDGVYRP